MEEAEKALGVAQVARAKECARAERAERALEEAQCRADHELGNAREAEERLRKVEAELFSYQNWLHTITLQVRGAEERADNAEEITRRSDACAAD